MTAQAGRLPGGRLPVLAEADTLVLGGLADTVLPWCTVPDDVSRFGEVPVRPPEAHS